MTEFWQKIISTNVVLLIALALFFITCAAYRRSSKKIQTSPLKDKQTLVRVGFDAVKVLIVIGAVVVILQSNGIDVSSLVTSLGLVSVVVGLALQDPMRDIIMGIHMLADRFFVVGDVVEYSGVIGVVEVMNLQTTKIRELETGSVFVLCNRDVDQVKVLSGVFDVDVPLSYQEDVLLVHQTLKSVANDISALESVEECAYLGTEDFKDSSILYKIRVRRKPKERFDVRRMALAKIQDGLHNAGIEVPFNQLDVHLFGEK